MVSEEERKRVLTDSQVDEVSLLLGKVRGLAEVMNETSMDRDIYWSSATVVSLTTDMLKNLDKIEATLDI